MFEAGADRIRARLKSAAQICETTKDANMILEVAILNVIPAKKAAFELAFQTASAIISSMPGYISHQLQRCLEKDAQYILLVNWAQLEDHTVGFRGSEQYQAWRELLHHFYDPFPTVEHYELIQEQGNRCAAV